MTRTPALFDDADVLAETIVREVGTNIVLALLLGLGKATHVANALYARAVAEHSIRRALAPARERGLLPPFPFGTDFTETEQRLIPVLERPGVGDVGR